MSGFRCAFGSAGGDLVDPVGKIGQVAVEPVQCESQPESPPDGVEIERTHDPGLPQPGEGFRKGQMRSRNIVTGHNRHRVECCRAPCGQLGLRPQQTRGSRCQRRCDLGRKRFPEHCSDADEIVPHAPERARDCCGNTVIGKPGSALPVGVFQGLLDGS